MQREASAGFVVDADRGARLHGVDDDAAVDELEPRDVRGFGESGCDLFAVPIVVVERNVAGRFLIKERRARTRGLLRPDHRGQGIDLDLDGFRSIFCLEQRLRHNEGDRVADEAHLVGRQGRPRRLLHGGAVAVLERHDAFERAVVDEIGTGIDGEHAGQLARSGRMDGLDHPVGNAAAHHGRIGLAGEAYAAMVRSRVPHGVIKAIHTPAARQLPGVLAVYTGADLVDYGTLKCIVPFKNRDGTPMKQPPRPALPTDKVRFVGDPIAFVVAETLLEAKDAAEAVEVEIESLPAVIRPEDAARPGAPLIHDEAPGNVALDYHYGDTEQVTAAFAKAAHVTRLELVNSRVVVNAMEPRAAIGVYDAASERFTLHAPSQGVFGLRGQMADILKVEPKRLRILTGHVGGSFGMKSAPFPEYVCVLHAARALGRPVKWTDERSGSFVSDSHGRDHELTAELALDADGAFLAVRITNFGNMGGYLSHVAPMPSTLNIVKNVQSVYRTPLVEVSTKCVFTNTSHVSAYRGAGRPEGNYYMERLIDAAAAETGIDRLALRRRNQIKPHELPIKTASGSNYDSGDFPSVLKHALEVADVKGFARRKRESRKRGKVRGLGVGSFLEVTAPPSKEMGGIRFEADGTVAIITGTLDYGQGHAA